MMAGGLGVGRRLFGSRSCLSKKKTSVSFSRLVLAGFPSIMVSYTALPAAQCLFCFSFLGVGRSSTGRHRHSKKTTG